MALTAGTRLGPYSITAPLAAGGMGEVYRARDTKLDRDVAIKVLPDLVSHDPERLARFEREAKTLASLNHPNIAIVHGFEETHGTTALVMELVEGVTLAARMAGPADSPNPPGPRWQVDRFRSTRRCRSLDRSPKRSKPPTSTASSTAT